MNILMMLHSQYMCAVGMCMYIHVTCMRRLEACVSRA